MAFYRDVLGIPHLFTVPGPADGVLRQRAGPASTSACRRRPSSPAGACSTSRSSDIDAEVERLTGLGVEFGDRPHVVHRDGATELWMAGLRDPDGHHVILMQETGAA